jgi:hypothetical protein
MFTFIHVCILAEFVDGEFLATISAGNIDLLIPLGLRARFMKAYKILVSKVCFE